MPPGANRDPIIGRFDARSEWLLELEDWDGSAWAVPQWDNIQVKFVSNKPATLTVRTIGGTAIDPYLIDRRADLILRRNGQPWFRGRIMEVDDDLTDRAHTIRIHATDYAGVLQHRYLQVDDLDDKVIMPNPDRVQEWSPIESYREGTVVADPTQRFPNQLYEAIVDTVWERAVGVVAVEALQAGRQRLPERHDVHGHARHGRGTRVVADEVLHRR